MIELFTADTPNGKKVSIMLEEIGFDYKVTKVDISKDEQFKPEFVKLSPFSKRKIKKKFLKKIELIQKPLKQKNITKTTANLQKALKSEKNIKVQTKVELEI